MAWTITDGTNTYNLLGASNVVRKKLRELDQAQVTCAKTFTEDTKVTIVNTASDVVFIGYVKESEQDEQTKVYKLTILETAIELKDTIVLDGASRTFIKSGQTVNQLVDLMLTGTGWTRGTNDTTTITSIGFSNTSVSAGLFKLLQDMQGHNIWFIDNATTKVVYWGTSRTDYSASTLTYYSKKEIKDSNNRNITKVTVYGYDDSIYYSAGTGTKERVYRYSTAKTLTEVTDVATKLLADLQNPRRRYEIKIHPNYVYEIGDLIKTNVTGSLVNYVINDIETTLSYTKLGIGSYELSYQDVLGTKLEEIKGTLSVGSDATWNGGSQNVSATQSIVNKYIFNCADSTKVSDFKLKFQVDKWRSSTSDTTEFLSDISQVYSSGTFTDTSWLSGNNYFPSTSGIYVSNSNGHQFGMAQFSGNFYCSTGAERLTVRCEYSTDGSSWTDVGLFAGYYINNTSPTPITFSCLVPGSTTTNLYIRFKVTPYTDGIIRVYYYAFSQLQTVTRHKHSVTLQTTEPDSTAITTCQYSLDGSDWSGWINGDTEISVTPVTGDNIFYIRNDGGHRCNVTATATYKTIGSS